MPSVFAEMRGDAIRTGCLTDVCSKKRIWITSPACVSNSGDVVDIDVEAERHASRFSMLAVDRGSCVFFDLEGSTVANSQ